MIDVMNPPIVPADSEIYCLDCFYDLRGIESMRCPECGRPFNPFEAATFSPVPQPTPVRDAVARVHRILAENGEDPLHRFRRLHLSTAARIAWLQKVNDALQGYLAWTIDVIAQRGLIGEAELQELLAEIKLATAHPTELLGATEYFEPDPPEETDVLTPELLELQRAAEASPKLKSVLPPLPVDYAASRAS